MARLPKNDKVVDIGTIAAALGVSKTTVSRAISGNGRVGAATRQRVQDYVKEHNYTPSVMARGLAMRCSYNISLVISKQFSDFEMPFLRKTMRSVYQAAEDCDYDVLLTLVGENETRPVERLLDNRKIDGLILTRTLERDPLIPLLKSRKLPFVAIGRPEDPTVMSVDHDQVGGCRELTSLLFLELETDDLRMQAVSQALERKPDCILCMDDRLTLLAMNMLKQQGVRVPQDIRVASLYDSSALAESSPAITAVQFDAYALGRKATQQLLQALKGREVETRVELGYQVSMRESTKT